MLIFKKNCLQLSLLLFLITTSSNILLAKSSLETQEFISASYVKKQILIAEQGLALVNIESKGLKGSGFFFLMDGKLRILTNAHIINDDLSAKIVARFLPGYNFSAKVIGVDLNEDFAILAPEVDKKLLADLITVASINFSICTGESDSLCKETSHVVTNRYPDNKIVYYDGRMIKTLSPENLLKGATKIQDQYVSGHYPYVWSIGVKAKNGVSGGSFYQDNVLTGMVTKISKGMQTQTIAIPIEVVGKKIKFMTSLQFNKSALAFKESNGGDLGNGGDQLVPNAPSPIWTLQNISRMKGLYEELIVDPFANAFDDSSIEIKGKKVKAFLQHPQYSFLKKSVFQAASYSRLEFFSAQKSFIQLLSPGDSLLNKIKQQRSKRKIDLNFLRVWKKTKMANHLLLVDQPLSSFQDGTISLYKSSDTNDKYIHIDSDLDMSDLRAYSGNDYWLIFSFKSEDLHIEIPRNLATMKIENFNRSNQVELLASSDLNSMKHVLTSLDRQFRSVMIYSETDLTQLESLLIETPTSLYEFTRTQPNFGHYK